MRHWLKTVVVSVERKGVMKQARQVRIKETNTSEPSFRRRKYRDVIKTGGQKFFRDKSIRNLLTGWTVTGV